MTLLNILIIIVSSIDTIILIAGIVVAVILWARGISPVLYRLGNGLGRRKIAIFAKDDRSIEGKNLLIDSGLFKEKNIKVITSKNDLGIAEEASIYLFYYWLDWESEILEISGKRKDKCPMIVYAPIIKEKPDKGRVPDDVMAKLDERRNTSVTNFRGRLLNDIVTSMITTSYR
ncbi:MAG: hypothetical protein HQK96_18090 [Nitrospirae bacterium]|nr:hypothetical protein [Nitrospirota bacterium]